MGYENQEPIQFNSNAIHKIKGLQRLVDTFEKYLIREETRKFVNLNEPNELEYEKLKQPQIILLENLQSLLEVVLSQIQTIENFAPIYDPKIGGEANGYRSFITINDLVIEQLIKECEKKREYEHIKFSGVFDRSFIYWIQYLEKLSQINSYLIEIHRILSLEKCSLFPEVPMMKNIPDLENVARKIALEDVSIFLDQGVATHINEDSRKPLKTFLLGQAFCSITPFVSTRSFSEMLYSLYLSFGGIRYLIDSQYLSEHTLMNARSEQVMFCKNFFNFSESRMVQKMGSLQCPHISTNCLIPIEPKPIYIQDNKYWQLTVNPPDVHIGQQTLNARFLCNFRTTNMVGNCSCYTYLFCSCRKNTSLSRSIIFHLHGSAFVSQTSKSHASYLTIWTKECDIPILSVDYSLAPEAPYPRAKEEAFYAYVWMRNNFSQLGTTGENVIFAGDSAGGTLITSLVLQCIEKDIPLPNHLFLMYPCLLVQMFPSPSRLLSLLDPLAMFPFLLRCMNAYSDPSYKKSLPRTYQEEVDASLIAKLDPFMSPLLASLKILSQFPNTHIFSSTMDTCLDECIEFSNKLTKAGAEHVSLDIFEGLPHGFMSLNTLSKECQNAVTSITSHIKSASLA